MLKMAIFTIGTQFDANGNDISEELRIVRLASTHSLISAQFGGCTVLEHDGSWIGSTGLVIREKGYTVKTAVNPMEVTIKDIKAMAENLAIVWGQECVLYEFDNMVGFGYETQCN